MTTVRVRREDNNVQVIRDGKLVFDMPWDAALEFADAIKYQAHMIEEIVKREQVVFDQAILNRIGMPIGIINNRHLQAESMHEAQYNRDLRRFLPGGIKSKEAVGTPTVRLVKP